MARIEECSEAKAAGAGPDALRTVTVNGQAKPTSAGSLWELAAQLGLAEKRVVAEMNGAIVPKAEWRTTALPAGATVEFVHFVGGG
nr:sulfur carrier protein ThiS [Cohnella sp. CFH 77786]